MSGDAADQSWARFVECNQVAAVCEPVPAVLRFAIDADSETSRRLCGESMPAYPVGGHGTLIALDKDVDLIPGKAVQIALSDCANLVWGDDRPQALAPLDRWNARLRTDEPK
jgi:hypothetical protein